MKDEVEIIEGTKGTAKVYLDSDGTCFDPIHEANGPDLSKADALLVSYHRRYGTNHGFLEAGDALTFASKNGMHAFAVRMYDHGGTAYRLCEERVDSTHLFPPPSVLGYPFNDQWDSGWLGYLLISNKFDGTKYKTQKGHLVDLLDENRRHTLFQRGESLLKDYQSWANGEIYGFRAFDKEGNELDSCWGFLGLEAAVEEATAAVNETPVAEPAKEPDIIHTITL
jgi:hypothetical protein